MQLSKWGGEKSAQPLIPKVNIEHVMKNQESSFEPLIMIRFLLVHVVAFAMTFSFRLNFIMFELIWISNQHFIIMWIGTSFFFCCVVHENFSISRTLWTSSFLPPSPFPSSAPLSLPSNYFTHSYAPCSFYCLQLCESCKISAFYQAKQNREQKVSMGRGRLQSFLSIWNWWHWC